jgi:hypothetical protein
VKHKRPFLRIENFAHPWQGFRAAVGQRVLSYGMYFPIQVGAHYHGVYICKVTPCSQRPIAQKNRAFLYHLVSFDLWFVN